MGKNQQTIESRVTDSFLRKALETRKNLVELKKMAVKFGAMEFAAEVRTIEKEKYPDTPEDKQRIERAVGVRTMLGLFGFKVDTATAWVIDASMECYRQKGGEMNLEDVAKIQVELDRIFANRDTE